jgi:hypothetical protein
MFNLIPVKKLKQKERNVLLPKGGRVVVLSDSVVDGGIREASIVEPFYFKGKVSGYVVRLDDGKTTTVLLEKIRLREETIPKNMEIESLLSPLERERRKLQEGDAGSLVGAYLRDFGLSTSLASPADPETLKAEAQRLKKSQEAMIRQERKKYLAELKKQRLKEKAREEDTAESLKAKKTRSPLIPLRWTSRIGSWVRPFPPKPTSIQSQTICPSPRQQRKKRPICRRRFLQRAAKQWPKSLEQWSRPRWHRKRVGEDRDEAETRNRKNYRPPDLLEVDCKPDKKDKNTFLCRVVSREQNPRDRKATSPKNARERFLLNTLDKHKPSKQQWLDVAPDLLLATDVVAAMEDVLDPVIFSRLQNGIKQSWRIYTLIVRALRLRWRRRCFTQRDQRMLHVS